ncbi:MAG: hypothetical protein EAY75_06080 [Bacteroidetes bacterium]|nr:MAG: hypothetical protein EAY75_06080 [Bacteroidota bacterium]
MLAQRISPQHLPQLAGINDSLGKLGGQILDDILPLNRLRADSQFTRTLVRGLRLPFSYYYPFDSVQTAPILYPADSSFRIMTWHYTLNESDYRQRGVIQMNTPDGSLKIFPLFDYSEVTDIPEDSIRTPQNWIGAVYYKLIEKSAASGKIYTLIGYDENNGITTRKWIDILRFSANGEPQFGGGQFFKFPVDSLFGKTQQRYLMEYKKEGRAKLNYDPEEDLVVMDNLVSETNEPDKKFTLVPGGDYEGLRWTNGQWTHVAKLVNQNLGDGNAPQPELIFDSNGIANQDMLNAQSAKNMKEKPKDKPAAKGSKKLPKGSGL